MIENEINRDSMQRAAKSETPIVSEKSAEEHTEQQESADVSDCENTSEEAEEQESTDFSDDFDSDSED